MATVTGLTALRMLAIEAASIIDGLVVGDELHLTTHGGDVINAGNVRGPQGEQGIQGPPGVDGTDGANGAPGAPAAVVISDPGPTALPNTYQAGISIHVAASGSGWPENLATVMTVRATTSRSFQFAVSKSNAYIWARAEIDSAWGEWRSVSSVTPHTRVRASSNQSIPNTSWTNVSFATMVANRGGMDTNRSASTFSTWARRSGLYIVTSTVRFATNTNGLRYLRHTVNAVEVGSRTNQAPSPTDATEVEKTNHLYLDAGDYVRTQVYQSSGAALNLEAINADASSYFDMTWIGH